tara:strand:- start:162 stop:647 length:486 start_codon:yes stop_codon:yes gene_type:complete
MPATVMDIAQGGGKDDWPKMLHMVQERQYGRTETPSTATGRQLLCFLLNNDPSATIETFQDNFNKYPADLQGDLLIVVAGHPLEDVGHAGQGKFQKPAAEYSHVAAQHKRNGRSIIHMPWADALAHRGLLIEAVNDTLGRHSLARIPTATAASNRRRRSKG